MANPKKTAKFLRMAQKMISDARVYELSEPFVTPGDDEYDFVIVSAVVAYSGPETYIFGSNEAGEVLDWLELPGSFRGGLDHEKALNNAGYEVVD